MQEGCLAGLIKSLFRREKPVRMQMKNRLADIEQLDTQIVSIFESEQGVIRSVSSLELMPDNNVSEQTADFIRELHKNGF